MHRRTNRRSTRTVRSAAITFAILTAAADASRAGTDGAWIGGGGDNNWSNANNWAANVIADGSDANATFAADLAADQTVTVDSARTVGNLSFSDVDPITTPANWIVNGSGPLTLQTSTGTPTITVNSLGTTNSVQFSVPLAGTQGILLAGSGTVVSTGVNTFTGGLTIPAGTTFSGSGDFLAGATNNLTVNGTFLLRTGSATNKVVNFLSGSGTIADDAVATGGGGFRIKAGSFSGNMIDGPGGASNGAHLAIVFDTSTAGLIDLSGVNTYTGDTLVRNGGTLRISSTTALSDPSFLRLEGSTTTTAAVELNAGGDFSRKLGGVSNSGGGGVAFNAGIDAFGTIGIDRKVTFTDGANPVALKWGTGGFSPTAFGLGTATSTNKTTLTNSIDINGVTGVARTLQAGAGSADVDAEFAGQISNSGVAVTLTLGGTGTMLLSADNSGFINPITIGNPIVRLATANSLGNATQGTVTINGGAATVGRLELTGGLSISKPISLNGRAPGASSLAPAISAASGDNTLAGILTLAAGGNLYNFSAEAGTLTLTGTLTNTGTGDRFLQVMGAAGQGFVPINITNGAGKIDVEKFGNSTWTFSGPANTYSGTTNVHAGTLVLASSQTTTSSITLDTGATLRVAAGNNKTIKTSTITANGTSVFDLTDNRLALTGVTPDALRQLLSVARAGGAWTGPGITSSSAAADPNKATAIGYALASDLGISAWGTASVNTGDTVARYTYYGDLNLDGKVDRDDYARFDRGMAKHATGWVSGDLNYDNVVDTNDLLLMDKGYILQGNPLSPDFLAMRESQYGPEYVSALLTSIPEPAHLATLGLAAFSVTRRRRRC